MPDWFLAAFAGLAVVGIALRLLTRGRWARPARPGAWVDLALVTVGGLGLAYHCGAMFYPATFDGAAALGGYAGIVQRLAEGSMVAYAVPAALVVVGIRRTPWWFVALVAAALVVVGVTMYDGATLRTHLTAIFVAVALLELGVAVLLPRPTAGPRARSGRAVTV